MSLFPYLWIMAEGWYPHLSFLVAILFKSAVVVLLSFFASLFLLQHSAKWRRRLWLTAFILLLFLPLIEWGASFSVRPLITVKFDPVKLNEASTYASHQGWVLDPQAISEAYQQQIRAEDEAEPKPVWQQGQQVLTRAPDMRVGFWKIWDQWAIRIWLAVGAMGSVWAILRHFSGIWWLKQNLREPSARLRHGCQEALQVLRLKRAVNVSVIDAPISPMVLGLWHSRLVFPRSAEEWSEEILHPVFVHELAHVERRDPLWQCLMRLGYWLVWWNPFLYLAASQFRKNSEAAADEYVLIRSEDTHSYAEALVDLARQLRARHEFVDGVFVIRNSSLETRIRTLLAFDSSRLKLSRAGVGNLLAGLAVALIVLIGRVGYGYTAPTAAQVQNQPHYDPSFEQPLAHYVETEEARQAKTRYVHFILEKSTVYQLPDGSTLRLPVPTHLEGWVDIWTGIRRFEYRPQATRWINGPSPIAINDQTEINDGTQDYYINASSDLQNLTGRLVSRNEVFQEDGTQSQQTALYAVKGVLTRFHSKSLFGPSSQYALKWIDVNGSKEIELVQAFYFDGKKTPSQREIFRFDPKHDDALVYYALLNPSHNGSDTAVSVYDVKQLEKSSAGFFYPAVYQTTFDNLTQANGDKEDSITTIKQYDILEALPQGIAHIPKPKGTKFIANDNSIIQPASIHLVVVDAQTGQPIPNSILKVRINRQKSSLQTNLTGTADIALPKEEVTSLRVRCEGPHYVPQLITWRKYAEPLRLPKSYVVHLTVGTPITGRIVDEAGNPIPNAEITAIMFPPRNSVAEYSDYYDRVEVKTQSDSAGRWNLDDFPPSLGELTIQVSHPGYEPSTAFGATGHVQPSGIAWTGLRDGSSVILLKRGNEVKGNVFDENGQPLPSVRLVIGKDIWGTNLPEATTDATGHFDFKGIATGPNSLTVQAAGHKPQILPLAVPVAQPMAIHLQKGRVLSCYVNDPNGKPLAGLNVRTDTWNTLRTLDFRAKTDASGHFIWDGAPDEPVTFSLSGGTESTFLEGLSLQARDGDQKIIMKPALELSAKVVDKKTGQPITRFRLTPGLNFNNGSRVIWQNELSVFGEDGMANWQTHRIGPSCVFKIEADGYEALISDPYRTNQSNYQATFNLVR